jgi:probable F420-dependent oxidoreductase
MKWGIVFASTKCPEPERAITLAQAAEQAGFESLWAPEHVVIPVEHAPRYGFSDDGHLGGDRDFPDPLIWLAYVAAATSTIRLGTGVLILPGHNPLHLAKSVATLDKLSGGRVMLGVGVGWLREEFDALDVPFTDRGARTDEYIDILRTLWRDHPAAYTGTYRSFAPLESRPAPVNGARVPIHCGGDSPAAARRAGRLGDGFFPAMYPAERVRRELPALLDELRRSAAAAGRPAADVEITSGGARTAKDAKWYADLGVARLTVAVRARTPDTMREELLRFGSEVIEPTADL